MYRHSGCVNTTHLWYDHFIVVHKPEVHVFNKRNITLSENNYCYTTSTNTSSQAACWYFGITGNGMPWIRGVFKKLTKIRIIDTVVPLFGINTYRNQKSEICLFNPFISYIEYSLIYIYKHMGQGDIC